MSLSRLGAALDALGGLTAPVLAVRPEEATDLGALPRDGTRVVTGFAPLADALRQVGWEVAPTVTGPAGAAVLWWPRARAFGRALVAELAAVVPEGAPLVIDGQKLQGIDPAWRDLRARGEVLAEVTKGHGRTFAIANPGPAAFADWRGTETEVAPGFVTRPGVFSADGVDAGSALLARHLPADLAGAGADLGAGWGWLAAGVLRSPRVTTLDLVEAEAEALACARRNAPDPRARFHWADATRWRPERLLDFVVTNPPFHTGRAADPALGAAFIAAAARMLAPSGRLWLVANRALPYEAPLAAAFAHVERIADEGGFKVFAAARPRQRGVARASAIRDR